MVIVAKNPLPSLYCEYRISSLIIHLVSNGMYGARPLLFTFKFSRYFFRFDIFHNFWRVIFWPSTIASQHPLGLLDVHVIKLRILSRLPSMFEQKLRSWLNAMTRRNNTFNNSRGAKGRMLEQEIVAKKKNATCKWLKNNNTVFDVLTVITSKEVSFKTFQKIIHVEDFMSLGEKCTMKGGSPTPACWETWYVC